MGRNPDQEDDQETPLRYNLRTDVYRERKSEVKLNDKPKGFFVD